MFLDTLSKHLKLFLFPSTPQALILALHETNKFVPQLLMTNGYNNFIKIQKFNFEHFYNSLTMIGYEGILFA